MTQSQHYAGISFDAGQILSNSERNRLRNTASSSGVWSYVEPASLTPTWVHFTRRFGRPACGTAGYPAIRRGSISTYVLIVQDDLNTLEFSTGGLDGIFGGRTEEAVLNLYIFFILKEVRIWMYHIKYSIQQEILQH